MSDNYPVDAETVRGNGTRGVMATGAGVGLWVVGGLLHIPVIGWILSAALAGLGILGILGRDKSNKAAGGLMMAAGGLGIAALLLPGFTQFLFSIGGLALVGYGIFSLIKFAKGVKSRS